jgi:hypothetical protein
VFGNARFRRSELLGEQVRLVEKQNEGDVAKDNVVDDRVENVARLV